MSSAERSPTYRRGHYTTPLRTVIDCLRDTPEPQGLAVLEHAVALGMARIDYRWHGAQAQLTRDAERYDELVALGYRVLRFAFDHITTRSDWIVDTVRRTLAVARASR